MESIVSLFARCRFRFFPQYVTLERLPAARNMASPPKKAACVIGGSGFVASRLVKLLLENGYAVRTTVRDPENEKKISHLLQLKPLGDLEIFAADLTDETSFHAPIAGSNVVFIVATPVHFASQDPENDMIKPAIKGVENVLKACAEAKTVKRVVLTSSAAAVTINSSKETGRVMDEENWTDVEFLSAEKPPTWGYPVSKTLAERAARKLADENGIDLVTVLPSLVAGRPLTEDTPDSIRLAGSLLTGDELFINGLKGMELLSGSISVTHVEDVCRAHLFLAEKESASGGRFICCAANTGLLELARFLGARYPQYNVRTEFGDFPAKARLMISSEKLIGEGFSFEHGLEDIYDEIVEYLKDIDTLK